MVLFNLRVGGDPWEVGFHKKRYSLEPCNVARDEGVAHGSGRIFRVAGKGGDTRSLTGRRAE